MIPWCFLAFSFYNEVGNWLSRLRIKPKHVFYDNQSLRLETVGGINFLWSPEGSTSRRAILLMLVQYKKMCLCAFETEVNLLNSENGTRPSGQSVTAEDRWRSRHMVRLARCQGVTEALTTDSCFPLSGENLGLFVIYWCGPQSAEKGWVNMNWQPSRSSKAYLLSPSGYTYLSYPNRSVSRER